MPARCGESRSASQPLGSTRFRLKLTDSRRAALQLSPRSRTPSFLMFGSVSVIQASPRLGLTAWFKTRGSEVTRRRERTKSDLAYYGERQVAGRRWREA